MEVLILLFLFLNNGIIKLFPTAEFLSYWDELSLLIACLLLLSKGQILRSTPNTAPLICGAYNTQPEGLLTTA